MKYTTILVTSSRVLIRSARRNPELNKKEDFKDKILRKYGKGKDIYVSFQGMPKIGINPNPLDSHTPMGIYAFPVEHIFDPDFINRTKVIVDRKYVYVMQKNSNKVLTLPDSSFNTDKAIEKVAKILVTKYRSKLSKKFKDLPVNKIKEELLYVKDMVGSKHYKTNSSEDFYEFFQNTLMREAFSYTIDSKKLSRYMNYILRDLGYDIVEDKGTNSIHCMEPYQTIFLTTSSFKVLGSVDNYSKGKEITDLFQIFDYNFSVTDVECRNIIIEYIKYLTGMLSRVGKYSFNLVGSKEEQISRFMKGIYRNIEFNSKTILKYPSFYRSLAIMLYNYDIKQFNEILIYLTRPELQEYFKGKDLDAGGRTLDYAKKMVELIFKNEIKKDPTLPIPEFKKINPKEVLSLVRI